MSPSQSISDELLAKYISGKASPAETEAVLSYLAENDESLEDFAHICAAVKTQYAANQKDITVQPTMHRRWVWIISSAAAVALVLVVSLFAFKTHNNGDNGLVAVNMDTVRIGSVVSETANPEGEINQEADKDVNDKTEEQSVAEKSNVSTPTWQGDVPKNYAAATEKTAYCNVISPAKDKIVISKNKTYFDFYWNTDAVEQELVLKDKNHQVIYQKLIQDNDYIKLKTSDYQNYNMIYWELSFKFSSGKIEKKKGEISFEK